MIKRRDCCFISILAVRKVGHLIIKTKMFDFEARVLIGWLANTLASQPIRTHASMSNTFIFMLRWPTFLTASIVNKNFEIEVILFLNPVVTKSMHNTFSLLC